VRNTYNEVCADLCSPGSTVDLQCPQCFAGEDYCDTTCHWHEGTCQLQPGCG
jgi:hypothetical protein